jgi:hypothetical protein
MKGYRWPVFASIVRGADRRLCPFGISFLEL